MIIHICGASGSGKTTVGNKLKEKYGNKIIVKDIDDLRIDFINDTYDLSKSWSFNDDDYQTYIDNYIKKIKKPLILVGIPNNPNGQNKKRYFNVHSSYNYYIKIDDMTIVKQRCTRFLTKQLIQDTINNPHAMNAMINDNDKFIKILIKGIKNECGYRNIVKQINHNNKYYKKLNYLFLSRENIFKKVTKLLNKI